MFTGEYQHSLDAKGRIILPSRIRSQLESGLVMHKWFDHCVSIMAQADFSAWADRLRTQEKQGDKRFREVLRWVFSGAQEDHVDKQGRITVPEFLRKWGGLERDITVIGAGNRVEVWDRDRWAERQPEAEAAMEDLSDLPL